mmetsp:Transcript_18189/g.53805  ORF Transcript_18189/g.53805 Transcript_18189/m.53805 type:complete len:206 (+) Transcript_18189:197-814(+)
MRVDARRGPVALAVARRRVGPRAARPLPLRRRRAAGARVHVVPVARGPRLLRGPALVRQLLGQSRRLAAAVQMMPQVERRAELRRLQRLARRAPPRVERDGPRAHLAQVVLDELLVRGHGAPPRARALVVPRPGDGSRADEVGSGIAVGRQIRGRQRPSRHARVGRARRLVDPPERRGVPFVRGGRQRDLGAAERVVLADARHRF